MFPDVLLKAQQGNSEAMGDLLAWYGNYLNVLAVTHLDRRLRSRINPSDLVQETMLAAYRDLRDFRGTCEPEFMGWLRQILIHCLHRAVDVHVKAEKRDVRREKHIPDAIGATDSHSIDVELALATDDATPSQCAVAEERATALANELAKLPADYRDVILFRNFEGLSFDEIAKRMHRTPTAARMLWLRAMDKLRDSCSPID